LANTTAAKSTTDRAAKLEADIAVIHAKLGSAKIVQNVNPLGSALEQMLGAAAATLTAWQQAIVAAVFELCLVGVMVIYELLGHERKPIQRQIGDARSQKTLRAVDEVRISLPQEIKPSPLPACRKAVKASPKTGGSVKSFVRDQVLPVEGERVEMKTLMQDYRAWCGQKSMKPIDLSRFLDEIEEVCARQRPLSIPGPGA
jgi:hypothetical protein